MSAEGEGTEVLFCNAVAADATSHDVVLQTLNQWRDMQRPDGKKAPAYFGEENFTGTEPGWEGVPIIFTEVGHPKVPFAKDPVKALETCKGRIVGAFRNASIDKSGTAKFTGRVEYSDPDVDKLHKEGKLALSSGFYSSFDSVGRLTGKVLPDHIIIFKPTPSLRPQDMGAMFLNAAEESKPDIRAVLEGFIDTLKQLLGSSGSAQTPVMNASIAGADGGETMTDDNTTTKLTAAIGERDTEIAALKEKQAIYEKSLEDYKSRIAGYEQVETERKKTEVDATWETIKKTALLPGQIHKPEDEAKLREQWEKDPNTFFLNAVGNRQRVPETGQEGSQFVGNASTDTEKEADAIVAELRQRRRR
jgi:hypothetical protein